MEIALKQQDQSIKTRALKIFLSGDNKVQKL